MIPDFKPIFCSIIDDNSDKSNVLSQLEQLNSNPSNWEYFVETAHKEKLLPLLYYACKQKFIEDMMPPSVVASMQSAYISNLGRTYFLKKKLLDLLNTFNAHHINIMLLKGSVHLVEPLYPDINTRMMSDIDIMAMPTDIPQIKQIFQGKDFRCIPDPWCETNKMNFVNRQFDFELHTRPFSDRKPPIMAPEDMWMNARQKHWGESTVYLPSENDMLYQCIFHEMIQHDHFFELQPTTFYEVDRMLKSGQNKIDLVALFERARHHRLEGHLALFFQEYEKLFHTPLPDSFHKLVSGTGEEFGSIFQLIRQLPDSLQKAGKRYFNFTYFYNSRHQYIKKFFDFYFLTELKKPSNDILANYKIQPSSNIPFFLIRWIHIARVMVQHVLVSLIFMYSTIKKKWPVTVFSSVK